MPAQNALRDRKRQVVRDEVADVALKLFARHGYEATTVDQIAAAAGLSTRSFFRYFASKDAVVTHACESAGTEVAHQLTTRPAPEPPWVALRHSFDGLIEQMLSNDPTLPMMRMIDQTPALYASHLHKQARWREMIGAALVPRLSAPDVAAGYDEATLRVRANSLAGAAISCLEAARIEWVTCDGQTALEDLLDAAMDAVHPLEVSR